MVSLFTSDSIKFLKPWLEGWYIMREYATAVLSDHVEIERFSSVLGFSTLSNTLTFLVSALPCFYPLSSFPHLVGIGKQNNGCPHPFAEIQ